VSRRLRLVRSLALQRKPLALSTLSVMLALGIAAAFGLSRASAAISWRGDYESGNFSQWNLGVQQKADGRASIVSSPGRQGRYAARYEVDPGDNNVAGSGSGERTEALTSQASTDGYEGHENWYAWSTMFAPGFVSDSTTWNAFTQFHQTGSTGQAVSFDVVQNTIIFLSWGGDFTNPTLCRATLDSNKQNGIWYDFVFHVKWSSNPSVGFFEIFENGKLVVPRTYCPTLYSGQGVYMKQGYYRRAQTNTAVVYDDGTRRGSSYADVVADFPSGTWPSTPGGTAPTPTTTPSTTTTATTTTTTPTTTAASPTTTTPPTTTAPPTTTTAPTTTSSDGSSSHGNKGNGHKGNGTSRFLASAAILRPTAHVRLVSSAIYLRDAKSLRISVVSRRRSHVRVPILAHSSVAGVKTGYWRKTLVTGAMANGRTVLQLRVPRSRLHKGQLYALRVRVVVQPSRLKTLYLPFRA
jgi:hypothetical protein